MNTIFKNEQCSFRIYNCRPFEEDGRWYVELWAYYFPESYELNMAPPFTTNLSEEIAKLMCGKYEHLGQELKGGPNSLIKVHIPKVSLDFECLTQVSEISEVWKGENDITLPVRNSYKVEAVNDILFTIEVEEVDNETNLTH